MGQSPELPTLLPETYRWYKSETNPRLMHRRALGEAIVGMKKPNWRGQYDLYLVANLRTAAAAASPALSLVQLKAKFESALLLTRYEHPECACTAEWDEQIPPIIQYFSPESNDEAIRWAQDATHVRVSAQSAHDVRYEIEEARTKIPEEDKRPSKSVDIYLIADVADENTPIPGGTPVEMLLHMNHLYWDGISSRMFVGHLFSNLSTVMGTTENVYPSLEWGTEFKNLSPSVPDAAKVKFTEPGDDYKATADEYAKALFEAYGGKGIKFRHGLATPRTDLHTFTPEQSRNIISAIKTRLGPKYTISHLAQAAVVMAMLELLGEDELSEGDYFVHGMPVNGRRFLEEEHAKRQYGLCETCAVVKVENLKELAVRSKDDKEAAKKSLTRATQDVKKCFDRWLSNPSQLQLGISTHVLEANFLSQNPMPFDKTAAPFFISDGRNDLYIPHAITAATNGETVIEIDNFLFLVNLCLPFLLESWKDASTLSVCYNDANHTQEEATSYLKSIADYMLLFAE